MDHSSDSLFNTINVLCFNKKKSLMCLSCTLLSRQNFVNPSCCNVVTGFVARLVQFKREIQFVVGSQRAIKTRDRGQQHSQNFKNISSENIEK